MMMIILIMIFIIMIIMCMILTKCDDAGRKKRSIIDVLTFLWPRPCSTGKSGYTPFFISASNAFEKKAFLHKMWSIYGKITCILFSLSHY